MVDVSQGQIYECDLGVQRGVELAGQRFALVVSHDDHNRSGQNVLVLPTTRGSGGAEDMYLDFYPWVESVGTRASCRDIRTVSGTLLGSLAGTATGEELRKAMRLGMGPYLEDALLPDGSMWSPGTVHSGLIPNARGQEEESWFMILTCNEKNGFATVVKVDQGPAGESQVRVALEVVEGPTVLTAVCHQVQSVDLEATFAEVGTDSLVGVVKDDCLEPVVDGVLRILRLSDR